MRDNTVVGLRPTIPKSKDEFKKIMIFSEGQVTEIDYFEGMKSYKRVLGIPSIIEIEPQKRPLEKAMWSNIIKVIEYIELRKEETTNEGSIFLKEKDELWIIFDKDEITEEQFNIGLEYAETNSYKIGFTNSCFEMWLLMHFDEFNKYDSKALEFSQANKNYLVSEVVNKSKMDCMVENVKE